MRRISLLLAALVLAAGIAAAPRHLASRVTSGADFTHFESPHVRPASMTPDGTKLLVVNTPDNRLSVFSLAGSVPARTAEIPVGLEPISVSALDNNTAWVVNYLSDDVSIVDLTTLHVKATLRVGDEPGDVVFAGTPTRAYVSVGQQDVIKVYDPTTLALTSTIPVNGRFPRALARNAAGTLVFAAIFQGGNRTTVLSAAEVQAAGGLPDDPYYPRDTSNKTGHPDYPNQPAPAPNVGAIVQYTSGSSGAGFYDEYGNNYPVPYTLAEVDIAEINASTNTVSHNYGNIGSTIFSVAVNPVDGKVAVTGMEARNQFRFEPKVKGYLSENRITFFNVGASIPTTRILNPHITYLDQNGLVINPGTQSERDSAISIATSVAWAANGSRVYVTSLGNDKLAVINPAAGSATSQMLARVPIVAGPTGVVVDDARGHIYVVGRFHNQLQTLSTGTLGQVAVTGIGMDPTPDEIVNGRKFFYNGKHSSHGDQACATCHTFGDTDYLPWDLGDPAGAFIPPPNPNPLFLEGFDPEKGPMFTQSLRGMTNTEPFHWRGDRVDLAAFDPAFSSLLGLNVLPDSEMTAMTDFLMPMVYPPNPNGFLNDSLRDAPPGTASAKRGRVFFLNANVDGGRCVDCHALPAGTNRLMIPDQLLLQDQDIKVPQLRNLYKKTGFTDAPGVSKHGAGFIHDGSIDNLFNFLQFPLFNFGPPAVANNNRRDVEAFLLSFDTGMSAGVGFQVTFDGTSNPTGAAQVDTLESDYEANRCDIVAKGRIGSQPRGWVYVGIDQWQPDKAAGSNLTTANLLALAADAGTALTVTGVPKGSGVRIGIDRDRDTYPDGDELDAGSDPGDPASTPATVGVPNPGEGVFAFEMVKPSLTRGPAEVVFTLGRPGPVDVEIFDVLGRSVRSLARGTPFPVGRSRVGWDGRRGDGSAAGTGVYFVSIRTEGGHWTRPVIVRR